MKYKKYFDDVAKLPNDVKAYRMPSKDREGSPYVENPHYYKSQKPVAFNVDGWPEEMILTAAGVARDLGYPVEFLGRTAKIKHRVLKVYNHGNDLGAFWRRLDEEGPAEFRLLSNKSTKS